MVIAVHGVWPHHRVIRSGDGLRIPCCYQNRQAVAGSRAKILDSTGLDCATVLGNFGFGIETLGSRGIQ